MKIQNLFIALALLLPVAARAQFTYITNADNTITITGYAGDGAVVIPTSTNGYPVVSIGTNAFYNTTSVTSVTIPNSVTSIGDYAFEWCGVTNMTIGNGVTHIGNDAFYECFGLTSVTIPNSVISMGVQVFDSCSGLTNINVAAGNPAYSSANGVLFDKAQTTLIEFPGGIGGNYIIPDSVTSIGDWAFGDCASLTSVTIPDSVTNIGDYAFRSCYDLASVTIGNSVASIGNGAFENCFLTSVTIPNSVFSIGVQAFEGCFSLMSATIGNSVTNIGDNAFSGDSVLRSVTIGNGVISIGDEAFSLCNSLTSVTIPGSVISIGVQVFSGSGLTNITVVAGNPSYSSANGVLFDKTQTTLVEFPRGIGGNYIISNSVTSIGDSAFFVCTGLKSVTIPNSVTNIGDSAFFECLSLTNVTMGNSVISIGNSAFYDCTTLKNVTIPNSVTDIGADAFQDCALKSVTIPDSVINIGIGAFQNCGNLTNAIIGDNVASIGMDAFQYCSGLKSVTIPDSVTNIGDEAFDSCSGLTNITCLGNAPALGGSDVFDSVHAGATVYYYAGTSGWGATYGGLPTMELSAPSHPPQITNGSAVVQSGNFSFTLTGASNQTIVVEASTNMVDWQSIWTNTLSGTSTNFYDSQWTNYPRRFYRAR